MKNVLYLRLDKQGDRILDSDTSPKMLGERLGVSAQTVKWGSTPAAKQRGIKVWDKVPLNEEEEE